MPPSQGYIVTGAREDQYINLKKKKEEYCHLLSFMS